MALFAVPPPSVFIANLPRGCRSDVTLASGPNLAGLLPNRPGPPFRRLKKKAVVSGAVWNVFAGSSGRSVNPGAVKWRQRKMDAGPCPPTPTAPAFVTGELYTRPAEHQALLNLACCCNLHYCCHKSSKQISIHAQMCF